MSVAREAALALAARGWPMLAIRPGGKEPLTPHGVKDATTDADVIAGWFRRWPDANIGVATGAPGPQVLDVDDLDTARVVLARLPKTAPTSASFRGPHVYLAGLLSGTIALKHGGVTYGELRGRGSYVVCPPSIHATGREYVWLLAPRGPLPPVPSFLTLAGSRAGAGEHRPPIGLVPEGQRWPYLRDFVVRLLRGGITDERRLLAHLQLEFEIACVPIPGPQPGALKALAAWAAHTEIARREARLGRRNGG